jgi:ribosomal protein L11 methyltransferase
MPGYWLEMSVRVAPETVESVSELMSRYVHGGVAIEQPYQLLDDGQVHVPIPGAHVTVNAYVPDDADGAESRKQIEQGLWHLSQLLSGSVGELAVQRIAEEDWANAWKEHYHVLHLGRRTVIKPSWRAYTPRPTEVVVELDPGMAFGTGLHPTTRNCLLALEEALQPNDTVLDVGTGSGILAIAALRLGATRVLALDVSPVAAAAAHENAQINGVGETMEVRLASLEGASGEPFTPLPDGLELLGEEIGVFDVVVANIIARVIAQLAPSLLRAVRPGGTVIASGIIADRRAEAEEPLHAAGLQDIRALVEGDWVTLVGKRPAETSTAENGA